MLTRIVKIILAFLMLSLMYCSAQAYTPWFTGPLIAPDGHVVEKGHFNFEFYTFYTDNDGIFNRSGRLIRTPSSISTTLTPDLIYGLTDKIDLQLISGYQRNLNQGARGSGVTDSSVALGYQILEQKDKPNSLDIEFMIQETLPTGQYNRLNPNNRGTNGIGMGSYQTQFNLNFQYLLPIWDDQYLRFRLDLTRLFASKVSLDGFNSYGGGFNTNGTIKPGNENILDLAAEWSLTQHLVPVMEVVIQHRQATSFNGFVGYTANNTPASIGHGKVESITLAPALEYNFSEHVGIIAGSWFVLKAKDTTDFKAAVAAINLYY